MTKDLAAILLIVTYVFGSCGNYFCGLFRDMTDRNLKNWSILLDMIVVAVMLTIVEHIA